MLPSSSQEVRELSVVLFTVSSSSKQRKRTTVEHHQISRSVDPRILRACPWLHCRQAARLHLRTSVRLQQTGSRLRVARYFIRKYDGYSPGSTSSAEWSRRRSVRLS